VLETFSADWQRDADLRAQPRPGVVHEFVARVVDLIDSHHGLARAILNVLVERPTDFDTAAVGARFAELLKEAFVSGSWPESLAFAAGRNTH
jgi:hypothetical protein